MNVSPIETLLSVLVAVATMLVIVGVAVLAFLNPVWVGFEQGRSGAVAFTGYTPAQVESVTDSVLSDLVVGPPSFAQTVDGSPVFTDRERAHMVDVRGVFTAFGTLVLLAIVLLIGARIGSHGRPWFRRGMGFGALALGVGVILGGIVSVLAFDQAFETFHELFFPGGSYEFDPLTDRLVQLFPIQFWEETSLALGVVILVLAGVVAWWGLHERKGTASR